MSRYIDADKFYASQVKRCLGEPLLGTCTNDNALLRDEIQKFPAADVKEVKHGEWITDKDGYVTCSECGEEHTWDDFRPPFCDMCGAPMDDGRLKNEM